MITDYKVVGNLRTSAQAGKEAYRYVAGVVPCSKTGILHCVYVSTKVDYATTDPNMQIFVFDHPAAAREYVREVIDDTFEWVDTGIQADLTDIIPEFPGAYTILGGKAAFPDNWVYPAPLGLFGNMTGGDRGKAYNIERHRSSYTGSRAQGLLAFVVAFPNGSTVFTGDDDLTTVTYYKCNYCGHIGTDFTGDTHVCPECGKMRECAQCDYVGLAEVCPHCTPEIVDGDPIVRTTVRTPDSTEACACKAQVCISFQLDE